MSDYDGLRLCPNCRDVYISSWERKCRACLEQDMIDDDVPETPTRSPNGLCPKCGCVMERSAYGTGKHEPYEPIENPVYYVVEECPCCEYSQDSYED